jgi:hypothetical protein
MLCNYLQLQWTNSGQVLLDLGLDFWITGSVLFCNNLFSLFAFIHMRHPHRCFYTHETSPQRAGVNQQPPVHQFRMRAFKPFWGITKNTSSSPAQDFSAPFSAPKFSPPPYLLPPPLLPPSPHFPLIPSQESSGDFPSLSSTKLWGDVTHKA